MYVSTAHIDPKCIYDIWHCYVYHTAHFFGVIGYHSWWASAKRLSYMHLKGEFVSDKLVSAYRWAASYWDHVGHADVSHYPKAILYRGKKQQPLLYISPDHTVSTVKSLATSAAITHQGAVSPLISQWVAHTGTTNHYLSMQTLQHTFSSHR